MKKIQFFFAIVCTFLMTSCGDFQEVTFSGIEGVKIIQMSQKGVEAELSVKIKNPNNTAFHIYPSDMDATLNGLNAGKALLTNNVRIKPNSEEVYIFKIKSDFSQINMADLPKIFSLAMSKNVKVGLKGDLKVGKFLVRKSFPVDITKNVPLGNFTGQ